MLTTVGHSFSKSIQWPKSFRDISPRRDQAGASSPRELAFLLRWELPVRAFARTGLTPPPQAATESPSARMFLLALISRSWQTPHSGQTHSRTSSGRSSTTCLQSWHVFEEGYQRSILMRVRPYYWLL